MEESVSAAEANRRFSHLLRGVREGRSYLVTSHGRPVARLVPAESTVQQRASGRAILLERLRRQPVVQSGPWRREELYEKER